MADFFRNKLVAGHAFHSATKVAALGILHAHPLLEPRAVYVEGVPYLREYIASLLWIDSTAFFGSSDALIAGRGARFTVRHVRLGQDTDEHPGAVFR